MPPRDWATELTAYAASKLAQNLAQIARCTAMLTPAELLAMLESTTRAACALVRSRGPHELLERREIQGYDVSELVAVTHVVEHFSFHTGQIVHTTKALHGVDLSQYDAQGRNAESRLP